MTVPMSSTGPYKSKVFNFLNRQSLRWGDRLTQAGRRLKITLEWGVQIAAYPLYLLVQTTRVAGRQFAAQQQKKALQEAQSQTEPASTNVASLILAAQPDDTTQTELQGIACTLENKKIVFVDIHNQAHQPEQSQDKLEKIISFHLSELNLQQRKQQQLERVVSPRILPPVQAHRPHTLLPIRWFLAGIHWLEQSPVAIAIDLFGESQWSTPIVPIEVYSPKLLPPLPLEQWIHPIDDRLAQFEQQLLKPGTGTEAEPKLPAIKKLWQRIFPSISNQEASALPPENTPDPWLQWQDLFKAKPRTTQQETQPEAAPSKIALPAAPSTPLYPIDGLPKFSGTQLHSPAELMPLVDEPSPELATFLTESSHTELAKTHAPQAELDNTSHHPTTEMEAKPAWIDTEALSVGYEQHFLERILKALDHLMAWFEHKISQFFSKSH